MRKNKQLPALILFTIALITFLFSLPVLSKSFSFESVSNKAATFLAISGRPTPGVCGATRNSCAVGTFVWTYQMDTQEKFNWVCSGLNNGFSPRCSLDRPVNGDCGRSNNTCNKGTLFDTADSATKNLWECRGVGGGSIASCSLAKSAQPTPPIITPSPLPTPVPPGGSPNPPIAPPTDGGETPPPTPPNSGCDNSSSVPGACNVINNSKTLPSAIGSCKATPYFSKTYKNPFDADTDVTFNGGVDDELIFNGQIIGKNSANYGKCNGAHSVTHTAKVKKGASVTIAVGDNHGVSVSINGTLSFTPPKKCVVIAVNGINSDSGFSNAVKAKSSKLTDPNKNFHLIPNSNSARNLGAAVKSKIDSLKKEDPNTEILVAAHSLGAIGTYNYARSLKNVTYLYYDPPYNHPDTISIPLIANLFAWIHNDTSNGLQIQEARLNGIAGANTIINWTGGLDLIPDPITDNTNHTNYASSDLNRVSSWVDSCMKK